MERRARLLLHQTKWIKLFDFRRQLGDPVLPMLPFWPMVVRRKRGRGLIVVREPSDHFWLG